MKCNYKNCKKEAITTGFVLTRNPDGGHDIPTTVHSCDKHKKVTGFFEDVVNPTGQKYRLELVQD